MKPVFIAAILLLLLIPVDTPAFQQQRNAASAYRIGMRRPALVPGIGGHVARPANTDIRPIFKGRPGHGQDVREKPRKCKRRRPMVWYPVSTTVVRESPQVVVVKQPPAPEPVKPPKPQKVWVPPVMATRIEPGFWDYGVKKIWMGDHWRFEQNLKEKKWVPKAVVEYVKQEGYWAFAE